MAKLIQHSSGVAYFSSDAIEPKLKEKRVEFLQLSLEAYKKANASTISSRSANHDNENTSDVSNTKTVIIPDSESTSSCGGEKINDQEKNQSSKAVKSTSSGNNNNEEDWGEEWLHHYMFGKIKEKLNFELLECLGHYKKVRLGLENFWSSFISQYNLFFCLNQKGI